MKNRCPVFSRKRLEGAYFATVRSGRSRTGVAPASSDAHVDAADVRTACLRRNRENDGHRAGIVAESVLTPAAASVEVDSGASCRLTAAVEVRSGRATRTIVPSRPHVARVRSRHGRQRVCGGPPVTCDLLQPALRNESDDACCRVTRTPGPVAADSPSVPASGRASSESSGANPQAAALRLTRSGAARLKGDKSEIASVRRERKRPASAISPGASTWKVYALRLREHFAKVHERKRACAIGKGEARRSPMAAHVVLCR